MSSSVFAKAADVGLRASLFQALLENCFDRQQDESKVTMLKLMALNFRDLVQIEPLFEELEDELDDTDMLRDAADVIIEG